MSRNAPLWVHWMRHAKVASHQGDLPLTDEGRRQVEDAGRQFSRKLRPGEVVSLLHAPTLRTRETALILYSSLVVSRGVSLPPPSQVYLSPPMEHWAIRNPDIYVAGVRIELVSTLEAVVEQLPPSSLNREHVAQLPFLRGFWADPDGIGYWVSHPNPPGEDADTVARRLLTFALSLLDLPRAKPRRYICVTHSPTMRAFLRRYLLGHDPGEPAYLESVDIAFEDDGSCTIQYRGEQKKLLL
jgi:broad specificity phosphatase PhoE